MIDSYLGGGSWPSELLYMKLLERMRMNAVEFQYAPARIVQEYIIDLEAEAEVAKVREAWAKRDRGAG